MADAPARSRSASRRMLCTAPMAGSARPPVVQPTSPIEHATSADKATQRAHAARSRVAVPRMMAPMAVIRRLRLAPPESPASSEEVLRFLTEVMALLRREHSEEFCGIVYVDSLQQPAFVKFFDPNNLGVSCGYSDSPPLPGWILSKMAPADLRAPGPLPGNRRRWWQRLFG